VCVTGGRLDKDEVPEVGEVLLGDYSKNEYYRGVVKKVNKAKKMVLIEFLDFGDSRTNTFDTLRIPTEELMAVSS